MNSAMSLRIESRIGTAIAAAALVAISALIAPTQTFATPTPLKAPSHAIEASGLFHQTYYANKPATDGDACDWTAWRDDECDEYSSDAPMW
jgi:hypothetical protein